MMNSCYNYYSKLIIQLQIWQESCLLKMGILPLELKCIDFISLSLLELLEDDKESSDSGSFGCQKDPLDFKVSLGEPSPLEP